MNDTQEKLEFAGRLPVGIKPGQGYFGDSTGYTVQIGNRHQLGEIKNFPDFETAYRWGRKQCSGPGQFYTLKDQSGRIVSAQEYTHKGWKAFYEHAINPPRPKPFDIACIVRADNGYQVVDAETGARLVHLPCATRAEALKEATRLGFGHVKSKVLGIFPVLKALDHVFMLLRQKFCVIIREGNFYRLARQDGTVLKPKEFFPSREAACSNAASDGYWCDSQQYLRVGNKLYFDQGIASRVAGVEAIPPSNPEPTLPRCPVGRDPHVNPKPYTPSDSTVQTVEPIQVQPTLPLTVEPQDDRIRELMKEAEVHVTVNGKVAITTQDDTGCYGYDAENGKMIASAQNMAAVLTQAEEQGYTQVRELKVGNQVDEVPDQFLPSSQSQPEATPAEPVKRPVMIVNEGSFWQCYEVDQYGTRTALKHGTCKQFVEALRAAAAHGHVQYVPGQLGDVMSVKAAIKKWEALEQAEKVVAASSGGAETTLKAVDAIMTGGNAIGM